MPDFGDVCASWIQDILGAIETDWKCYCALLDVNPVHGDA